MAKVDFAIPVKKKKKEVVVKKPHTTITIRLFERFPGEVDFAGRRTTGKTIALAIKFLQKEYIKQRGQWAKEKKA